MTTKKMTAPKISATKISVSASLLIAALIGGLVTLWVTYQPLAIQ